MSNTEDSRPVCSVFEKGGSGVNNQLGISGVISETFYSLNKLSRTP